MFSCHYDIIYLIETCLNSEMDSAELFPSSYNVYERERGGVDCDSSVLGMES